MSTEQWRSTDECEYAEYSRSVCSEHVVTTRLRQFQKCMCLGSGFYRVGFV